MSCVKCGSPMRVMSIEGVENVSVCVNRDCGHWKVIENKSDMVRPIGKYMLVKIVDEEVVSSSGIVMSSSDMNDLRYQKATVKYVGDEVSKIEVDSLIYYDKHAGYTMMVANDTYTVISERDVVVVLSP